MYLRTSPQIVYERMRARARKEEDCVSLNYLEQIHQVHDDWLLNRSLFTVPAPVIILNADQSMEEMFVEFENCKENIFGNENIHNEIPRAVSSSGTPKKITAGASD